MADSVVLLWLEGPMQSWGTRSRWDVRDTGLDPTKSGVIGLLGCALGLPREDSELERLDQDLLFGVRVDCPGVVSADYQTVTGYHRTAAGGFKHRGGKVKSLAKAIEHEESTIVSPREYLHDAAFLVALASDKHELLRRLAGDAKSPDWSLSHPKWPLYLGRKSCVPVRPVLEPSDEYTDLETALKSHARHPRAPKGKLAAYIEDPTGDLERQDAVRLNQLRMYEFRRCRYLEVDPPCTSRG